MSDPDIFTTMPMRRPEPAEPSDFLDRVRALRASSLRALELFTPGEA